MPQMAIEVDQLRIVHYPAPVLRRRAKAIDAIDEQVRRVAEKMLQLMHEAPGVGLAAPQVGLPWRMFVACPTGETADDRVFINPRITNPSRQAETMEEGCLSLPEINVDVLRPRQATVEATDLDGNPFTLTSDELPARIWQHETDHLDGILIIDRMKPMDRLANEKQIRELERAARA